MKRLVPITLAILATVFALGCDDDDDDASDGATSCDDLQTEADGCKTSTQGEKDAFAQVGATCKAQARFTAECRKCLHGKICGDTQACDPLCGK